jgi:heptosyltransferase-3
LQPDASMRRVLIYRLGSLGDTVAGLPCFHLIARKFPAAERKLLTNFPVHAKAPASAAVLGDSGLVHGYMRYTAGTRNPLELLRLAVGIRRFRPDVLVYLTHIRPWKDVQRDRLFLRVADVRRIVGIAGETEIRPVFDAATGRYESEAARLARLVAELGDANLADRASWDPILSDAERQAAREALGALAHRPLIFCGPGTKRQAKDWGQENWRALLAELSGRYRRYGLVLVGAEEEYREADYAAQQWTGPKLNLCGRLTPRATAAALCYAKIFLGPDSGPMHVAAAMGTPCVIAFSASTPPGAWFPHGDQHQVLYRPTSCLGCYLESCTVEGRRGLSSITVREMAAAVDKVLGVAI